MSQQIETVFQLLHIRMDLIHILFAYGVMMIVVAVINYLETIAHTTLQENYDHHLRTQLHEQLLHTKWSYFTEKKRSDFLLGITTQ